MIVNLFKKILYSFYHCSSNKRYVSYLRKKGAEIGQGTVFLSPRKTFFDYGRSSYITIGKSCVICSGVTILAHDYSWSVLVKSHNLLYPSGGGPVVIGDNCFIGVNAMVLRNVSLGNNVIVAAGAVVTKSFGSNVVIGGNPAKEICSLDEYMERRKNSYINELKSNIQYIKKKFGRDPTEGELKNFCSLWSADERKMLAVSADEYKSCLKEKPLFENFEQMLNNL